MGAAIFNGTAVKILKDILRFKDGTDLTSTQVSDYLDSLTDNKEPTGVVDRDDSTISFSNANRRFTIAPAVTSFDYYIKGVKYTKSGSETIDISADDGLHYIYYDGSSLAETTTWSNALLCDYAILAIVRWDSTNSIQLYFADERHGAIMDCSTHTYLHNTLGTVLESGGALTDITPDEDGDANSHARFGNEATTIWDEDLQHILSARTSTTNINIYYRTGADASNIWRTEESTFGVFPAGSGRAAYNQNNAGTWQLTEVSNLDFVLCHVFAYNDTTRKFACVMGQNEYATLRTAKEGALTEIDSLVLAGFIFPEVKFLGTIIYQTSNTYANSVQSRIRSTSTGADYVDLRDLGITRGGTSGVVSDHGALTGLADDDHLQYLNLQTRNNLNVKRDVYAAISHDDFSIASSWDVSNISNATLTSEETNHLSGTKSFLLTNVTGSGTEYIETVAIPVPKKARGKENAVIFPYTYDGDDGDFTAQIYDVTNSTLLETAVDIEAASNGKFILPVYFPSTTASIKLRITVATENNGKLLVFDDLVFTDDPLVYKNLYRENVFSAVIANSGTATITSQSSSDDPAIASVVNSGGVVTGTFTPGYFTVAPSLVVVPLVAGAYSAAVESISTTGFVYRTLVTTTGASSSVSAMLTLQRQGDDYRTETEHIVTPIKDTKSIITASISGTTGLLTSQSDSRISCSKTSTGVFSVDISSLNLTVAPVVQTTLKGSGVTTDYVRAGSTTTAITVTTNNAAGSVTDRDSFISINLQIPDMPQVELLGALPVQRTAYIKDVKASGTSGGTATSGSYLTRTLNTVTGDTEIVSLSSNQFTLGAGEYEIEITVPSYSAGMSKAGLTNITDSSTVFYTDTAYSNSSAAYAQVVNQGKGKLTITSPKVFEVKQRVEVTQATTGLGRATSFGDDEIYTTVKITKIK